MTTQEISAAHENSIRQLIDEFEHLSEMKVRAIYVSQREQLEEDAKIHLFIPFLACRDTRQILSETGS